MRIEKDRMEVVVHESSIRTAANASRQAGARKKKTLLHGETDVAVIILYL